jgi:hypothetical protein
MWPPSFDQIWQALIERHGKHSGTRQMIDLLKLSEKHGHHKLQEAIESALANRCYDGAAVQHLLNAQDLQHTSCEAIDVGRLDRYTRPLPTLAHDLFLERPLEPGRVQIYFADPRFCTRVGLRDVTA